MPVTMATAVTIGKMTVAKIVPNVTLTHTPPPTGNLPTFPDGKDSNKIKK